MIAPGQDCHLRSWHPPKDGNNRKKENEALKTKKKNKKRKKRKKEKIKNEKIKKRKLKK
jgi:hypothetical protein